MTDGYLLLIVQDAGSYTVQTFFFLSLCASLSYSYRGADKSLARPGRKEARVTKL